MKNFTHIKLVARGQITNNECLRGTISSIGKNDIRLIRSEILDSKIPTREYERVAFSSISVSGAFVKITPDQVTSLNDQYGERIKHFNSSAKFGEFYKDNSDLLAGCEVGVTYSGQQAIYAILPLSWLPTIGIDNLCEERKDIELHGRLGVCSYKVSENGLTEPELPDGSSLLTPIQYEEKCAEMFGKRVQTIIGSTNRLPEILQEFLTHASPAEQEQSIQELEQTEWQIKSLLSALRNNRK